MNIANNIIMPSLFIDSIPHLTIPGFRFGFIKKGIEGCSYQFKQSQNGDYTNLNHNVNILQKKFNLPKISILNQIHSNIAHIIEEDTSTNNIKSGDAQITNLSNVALAVLTADCGPIILIDQKTGYIASIHAGWRGAKSGIIENTIEKMVIHAKSSPSNMVAIIGPLIHVKSYEISTEFMQSFLEDDSQNEKYFIKYGNEYHFDLKNYITNKLQKYTQNIYDFNEDTYTNPDKWFSYRRFCHNKNEEYGSIVSFVIKD